MFDIGWQELFIVVVLTVVVVGPKDLPRVIRTVSSLVRKARSLAGEFQRGLDDVVREAELDDLKKDIENNSPMDIAKEFEDTIDPGGDMREEFDMSALEDDLNKAVEADPAPDPGPKTKTDG